MKSCKIRKEAIRDYGGLHPTLGRVGSLEVRLAITKKDVRRAQRLRFEVFYEEMTAVPNIAARLSRRDIDDHDRICDHLIVVDHDAKPEPQVVGTYRLLRQDIASRHGGFLSAGAFDLQPIIDRHSGLTFLELGRACVLKPYRNRRTVELLWQGIWAFVLHSRVDVMVGCASLEGTDPSRLALPLSFLHHHAQAPEAWRATAVAGCYTAMDRLPREAVDPRAALHALPPLIKGYLRLGATFGDGAVIDRRFGTTDVLVVLPVSAIDPRYIDHFSAAAERYAA